jgi:hypothetical protein
MTRVIEIVADHLRSIGADGLVCPDADCGCELAQLEVCEGGMSQCQPGWKGAGSIDSPEWRMFTTREAAEASREGGAA